MSRPAELSIEQSKLDGYLLNLAHPEGGSKAQFFIACGFDPTDPKGLADALADHAIGLWPGTQKPTPYGLKHVLEGQLSNPTGRAALIRAVWQIRPDGRAWLVTAYPI